MSIVTRTTHSVDTGRAVVLALGNRFRGDDGVGPYILDHLGVLSTASRKIDGVEGADDAMAIVNAWQGAELALVVDAAATGASAGTVHRLETFEQLSNKALASCSSHGLGLVEAIELGQALHRLPARLIVYAIEARTMQLGAPLSAEVKQGAALALVHIRRHLVSFLGDEIGGSDA